MENLNAEQIIKALECCKTTTPKDCIECPYRNKGNSLYVGCVNTLVKDALSLIKELTQAHEMLSESYDHLEKTKDELLSERARLTEENERLRGVGLTDDETYIRLSDAKTAIMAYIGEQTVSKYASSEECKAARCGAEGAMNELDYLIPAKVAPIADTVRKMHEKLDKHFCHDPAFLGVEQRLIMGAIDQIAKEMLEGKDENT